MFTVEVSLNFENDIILSLFDLDRVVDFEYFTFSYPNIFQKMKKKHFLVFHFLLNNISKNKNN